jgi:hypothetical protein
MAVRDGVLDNEHEEKHADAEDGDAFHSAEIFDRREEAVRHMAEHFVE